MATALTVRARTASPGGRPWLVGALALGGILPACAAEPASERTEPATSERVVEMRVADLAISEDWYRRVLGFAPDGGEAPGEDERLLRLGRAVLVLAEADPDTALDPSNLIKVGLLVSDLEALEGRVSSAASADLLVDVSALPPAPDLERWPTHHLLLRDPDGTLVQAFERSGEAEPTRWFLAALTVDALDDAVGWFDERLGYAEVARPDGGDPRALLVRDDFYLEVGEFGGMRPAGTTPRGVTALGGVEEASTCARISTPFGIAIGECRR